MVVIYALLIIKGLKTFAQVPNILKAEVKAYLFAMDLDENGKPLPVEPPVEEPTSPTPVE